MADPIGAEASRVTTAGFAGDGAAAAAQTFEDLGGAALADDPSAFPDADVDVLVALGEDALVALVDAGVTQPLLPVGGARGVGAVPRNHLDAALGELVDGSYGTVETRLLDVVVDGDSYRALADARHPAAGEDL